MPERPTFQRRLLLRLGVALALVLLAVGAGVWGGAAMWATADARGVLRAEIAGVQSAAVAADGTLHAERYLWDEPHHQYATPRIDPIFLQVFDVNGRLLRASGNVARLGAYPSRALPSTEGDGPLVPLAAFRAGGRRLYRVTEPIRTPSGAAVGTVQAARYPSALSDGLGRLALGLALGLGATLALLLALVRTIGARAVRPLHAITTHAAGLSAATLGERVPVPPGADRETAALAATLNGSLDRLDGAFADMSRFTSHAAHELQTPLTVLRGHVEVALRRERAPESYRETLHVLDAEVGGMVRTVRALLALARLDAAEAPLTGESVDLAALAAAEAEAAEPRALAAGLVLTVGAPVPVAALGHADLLRDAVRTLLDNAIKFTPAGRVTVTAGTDGAEAWIAVEDTGPGLSAEQRARATARFWRADGMQHVPGSGLGLALADRIARSHGGRLVLTDAAPHGLRAVVAVPAGGVGTL